VGQQKCFLKEVKNMLAKRKLIQHNLVKNSIAAYFAAIEIHNKPNILYRYETVTILMLNAWELLLKAFVRKYIKHRSIYEEDGHTISFNKAVNYVNEHLNAKAPKSFIAIMENLIRIESYRNKVIHYYNEQITPYIFMLMARCAVNYVEFIKLYFGKDIMEREELFIMPLGFKLPFKPEDFLSRKAPAYTSSKEAKEFIESIITVTKNLNAQGVEDSIVLGFELYLESVKKAKNSDLLVAITSKDEADVTFVKKTKITLTEDPNAQIIGLSDEEFRDIWKYNYGDVVSWCRLNIPNFKRGQQFNKLMKELKADIHCTYKRRLDSHNLKSVSQDFYTETILEQLKEKYTTEEA
jgi:hypothetical protein